MVLEIGHTSKSLLGGSLLGRLSPGPGDSWVVSPDPGAFWVGCFMGRVPPGAVTPGLGASWVGCFMEGDVSSTVPPRYLPRSLSPLLPPTFPSYFTRIDHLIERLGKGSYDKPKDSVKPNNPDVGIILPCEVSRFELVILHP